MMLAREIAEKITSKHNQHCSILIVGPMGTGKSWTALWISYRVSVELANILGGKWQDYFSVDENTGIIDTDDIIKMVGNMKEHRPYIADDIGATWDARDFAKKGNKLLNKIAQTWRTENNLLILTIPDNFLLDKVPRSLVNYFIEMEMGLFDYGISVMKLFEVVRKHRQDKTHYVYIRNNGRQFVRHVSRKPPDEILDEYEPLRKQKAKELKKRSIEEYYQEKEGGNGKGNKKEDVERRFKKANFLIEKEGWTQNKALNFVGMDYRTYKRLKGEA